VLLVRGISGDLRLTKHLKRTLHGSVARDFAGGYYDVSVALKSAEAPRFEVPEMRIGLEWQAERDAYILSFLSGAQVTTVESTEGVSQILAGREFSRWAPSPFGVTVSFT